MKNLLFALVLAFIPMLQAAAGNGLEAQKGKVYENPEVMPQYPGGSTEMMKFLTTNVVYPKDAAKRGEKGNVVVQFVVAKDGSLKDVKVLKSVSPTLDKAAMDVVKKMPRWTPGTKNGKPVDVHYCLPIRFAIQ